MAGELIGKRAIPELVALYTQAVGDVRHAFAVIDSAERRLSEAFGDADRSFRDISVHEGGSRRISWSRPDEALKEVRSQVWRAIVDRSEVRRFLSIAEAEKLDKQLGAGEMPEISLASVADFVNSMTAQLPELADAAIREVFDWLRPRAGYGMARFKTNKLETVGERVIVTSVIEVDRFFAPPPFRVSYYSEKRLTALENVFRGLDGQGQRTKSHYSELSQAIKDSPDGAGETTYFAFRAYKNGSLHLRFKRLDLLQQLNSRAAGKALASGKLGSE